MKIKFVQIELTTKCNFNCTFCMGRSLQQSHMSLDTFNTALDFLEDVEYIHLQGEGESLLNKNFFEIVSKLTTKFPKSKLSLITNGSLFAESIISKLITSGINHISISIESTNVKQYDKIRKGKKHQLVDVIYGIQNMMKMIKTTNSLMQVGFSVTVLKNTIQELPKIVNLYKALGMNGGITMQPLQDMPGYYELYDDELKKEIPSKEDMKDLSKVINKDIVIKNILHNNTVDSFFHKLYAYTNISHNCPWLIKGVFITAKGTATSCCYSRSEVSLVNINELRASLARELEIGRIPIQCANCKIAKALA